MKKHTGSKDPLADCSKGTQVLFAFAVWQKQKSFPLLDRVVVFRKGDVRLVVHGYGSVSVCLKIGPQKPKIQEFREWNQSIATVAAKLLQTGWAMEEKPTAASCATLPFVFTHEPAAAVAMPVPAPVSHWLPRAEGQEVRYVGH